MLLVSKWYRITVQSNPSEDSFEWFRLVQMLQMVQLVQVVRPQRLVVFYFESSSSKKSEYRVEYRSGWQRNFGFHVISDITIILSRLDWIVKQFKVPPAIMFYIYIRLERKRSRATSSPPRGHVWSQRRIFIWISWNIFAIGWRLPACEYYDLLSYLKFILLTTRSE